MDKFSLYFRFTPILLYFFELAKKGSGYTTITYNKIRFSAVHLSGTIRLRGTFTFALFPFYPNECILLGGTRLGGILANPVAISHLLGAGFH